MKPHFKSIVSLSLFLTSFVLSSCSGPGSAGLGPGPGPGSGSGPFTVGGTVTGLTGTGLVLQNNAGDSLAIAANGTFTFKTAVARGQPYNVSVSTPPSTPSQTCTVASGTGTATANVTGVQVTCSTGTVSIGVTVGGLTGTGLVLQNGTEFLAITGTTTTSQFKTAIPFGQTYNVTVSTQPTSPAQTCTVTNGSGTATAGVAVNVQVTCSLGTLSIGGSVSGYSGGTGFALQNNGADTLTITKNGAFTFPTLVPVNGAYKVTVSGQPSGPNQTCTVSFGTGTAAANVTNVSVVCPAVFHPINVSVVGVLGANGAMQLLDNGGDNLLTPKMAITFLPRPSLTAAPTTSLSSSHRARKAKVASFGVLAALPSPLPLAPSRLSIAVTMIGRGWMAPIWSINLAKLRNLLRHQRYLLRQHRASSNCLRSQAFLGQRWRSPE